MSRNGSGVYSLPAGNPVVTGTTISSSWANTTLSDIATALTGSVAADGQTAMTGNLQMGNNKVTGLAVATTSGDALSYAQAATVSDLAVTGNATVGGTLTLTGGLTLNGNVTVGDSSSDTLTVNATSTFAAGATFSSTFAANGGVTLGDASGDALTINSSAVSIPNGLNFDSNTLVIDATNNRVGIGTASPLYKLQITTATSNWGWLATDGTREIGTYIDSSGGWLGTRSNDNLLFMTNNGGAQLVLATSGSLGLGATPSSWTGGLASAFQVKTGSIASSGAGDVRMYANTYYDGSYRYIGSSFASYYQQASGQHIFAYTSSGTAGNAITWTEAMRINASGNVGIGTSSPTDTISFGRIIDVSSSSLAGGTYYRNSGTGYFGAVGYDGTYGYLGTWGASAGALRFYTNSTEKMRLDSSGNLGLGVTPSAWGSSFRAIQLYGGALMSNASATGLYMPTNAYYNGTNYIYSTTAAASNYTQTAGEHKWFNAASGTAGNAITFTQAMTLDANNNLMIGGTTTAFSSGYTFVNALGSNGGAFEVYSGTTRQAQFFCTSTTATLGTVASIPLIFNTANTERMRIDSSGNLLVNTTSASGKLTVKGINNSSTDYGIYVTDSSGNLILGTRNDGYIRSPSTYAATSASAANITIDSSGYMYRSTSALKYKQDIRDLESIDINKFRPVRYKSKCESDDQTKDHFGIIADEVDTVGITELVNYGADGEVEGFQYERLTVVLLKELQTLRAEVDSLKAQLNK